MAIAGAYVCFRVINPADYQRRYMASNIHPRFPFGFGLTYSSFEYGPVNLTVKDTITFPDELKNTGLRQAAEVMQ